MKLILFIFIISLCACRLPPCSKDDETSHNGIYSKFLGTVKIDGQDCQIFEQFEKYGCELGYSEDAWTQCEGSRIVCRSRVLTRITKCPTQISTNTITMEPCGKSLCEKVR